MNYICKYLKEQKHDDRKTTYSCEYYNDTCPNDVEKDEDGRGLCYRVEEEDK